MAAFAAPPPPDVARQMASPEAAQSVFAANGLNQPPSPQGAQVTQQIQGALQELDQVVTKLKTMLDQFDPSLSVFVQPRAQAGAQLAQAMQEKMQRSGAARGSSVVPPNAAPNPSAGPPMPAGM